MYERITVWCLLLWIANIVQAFEPRHDTEVKNTSTPIVVGDCRIKLMDRVVLASDRVGILDFVVAQEGDRILKDQVAARLKDSVIQARLSAARKEAASDANVRLAEKAYEFAVIQLQKSRQAFLDDAVTELEIKRLEVAAAQAKIEIEAAQMLRELNQETVKQVEAELGTHVVHAPFSGVVTRLFKQKGEAVNQGDPILELTSTRRVKVEGYVIPEDAWRIKKNTDVLVTIKDAKEHQDDKRDEYPGRIQFVDVSINPVTRKVRFWAEVGNSENSLKPGVEAEIMIYPDREFRKPGSLNVGRADLPMETNR